MATRNPSSSISHVESQTQIILIKHNIINKYNITNKISVVLKSSNRYKMQLS